MSIKFRLVDPSADASMTNYWRSSKKVEATLRSSFRHSDDAQKAFLESKNGSSDYLHWIVQSDGVDFAYFMALDHDPDTSRLSWGYWIGNDEYHGFGALVPVCFYNLIFVQTKIESIRAEVLSHNEKVLSMHKRMGYQELYSIKTETHNMTDATEHVLILTKPAWQKQPKSLLSIHASFEIPANDSSLFAKIKI
jgi:hypothetical protein